MTPIRSTFLAWLFRMPLIRRWSLMYCVKPENVAEHSHQVAIVAHLLAVIKNRLYGGDLVPERAATIALYHECSETRLGDIVSPVKYSNSQITSEFKKLEAAAEQHCLDSLPEALREDFADLLIQSRVDPEYAAVVKAADVICAYLKAKDELAHNNHEFSHVAEKLEPRLAELRQQPEVAYFLDVFLASCGATLDSLASPS
ncbi:5'-deoxynucleotidase [Ferrimonas balearica]|uniref:5'-deoxynucleotidase n=1 Tax=Ferrimonas balearica TaxID=44012 RepID=UPI001C99E274|nr:5'-deoxynucleotidase [Ferrimonas balearica]MBY5920864.1 5'-deoxynucleotidase [Ferrimonas balearica]MBY5996451.1 5'-deoxynucleotidase [Ferrimonas balearica]